MCFVSGWVCVYQRYLGKIKVAVRSRDVPPVFKRANARKLGAGRKRVFTWQLENSKDRIFPSLPIRVPRRIQEISSVYPNLRGWKSSGLTMKALLPAARITNNPRFFAR